MGTCSFRYQWDDKIRSRKSGLSNTYLSLKACQTTKHCREVDDFSTMECYRSRGKQYKCVVSLIKLSIRNVLYTYLISHQSALMDITYGWARLTFFSQTTLHFFYRSLLCVGTPAASSQWSHCNKWGGLGFVMSVWTAQGLHPHRRNALCSSKDVIPHWLPIIKQVRDSRVESSFCLGGRVLSLGSRRPWLSSRIIFYLHVWVQSWTMIQLHSRRPVFCPCSLSSFLNKNLALLCNNKYKWNTPCHYLCSPPPTFP